MENFTLINTNDSNKVEVTYNQSVFKKNVIDHHQSQIDSGDYVWVAYDGEEIQSQVYNEETEEYEDNTHEPTLLERQDAVKGIRKVLYQVEADPLFMEAKYDEAAETTWRAKVAEIKAAWDIPSE